MRTQVYYATALDWSGVHPALAKKAKVVFGNVRALADGRLSVMDMRKRFGDHGRAMLAPAGYHGDRNWAELDERWKEILCDWGMCVGIAGFCPGGAEREPERCEYVIKPWETVADIRREMRHRGVFAQI